jgi:hypothetical protein
MYSQLREALEWRNRMPGTDALLRNLEANATRRYANFANDTGRLVPEERARLEAIASNLDDCDRLMCISAPQGIFASSLVCAPEDALEFFEGAFAVAAIEAGGQSDAAAEEIWSANGDRAYRRAAPQGSWTLAFAAPVIDGYLPVDMRSPAIKGTIPGVDCGADPISEEDQHGIFTLLGESHALIEQGAPNARQFLEDFARVIVACNCFADREFRSAGARLTAGRMVMINPLFALDKPELITDGLLHESIHCAIDHCEFAQPILKVIRTDATIVSPWTGKLLDLNTFIHASFVWYGLVNFWTMATANRASPTAGALEMLATARRGFEASRPSELIAPFKDLLDLDVVRAVNEMKVAA